MPTLPSTLPRASAGRIPTHNNRRPSQNNNNTNYNGGTGRAGRREKSSIPLVKPVSHTHNANSHSHSRARAPIPAGRGHRRMRSQGHPGFDRLPNDISDDKERSRASSAPADRRWEKSEREARAISHVLPKTSADGERPEVDDPNSGSGTGIGIGSGSGSDATGNGKYGRDPLSPKSGNNHVAVGGGDNGFRKLRVDSSGLQFPIMNRRAAHNGWVEGDGNTLDSNSSFHDNENAMAKPKALQGMSSSKKRSSKRNTNAKLPTMKDEPHSGAVKRFEARKDAKLRAQERIEAKRRLAAERSAARAAKKEQKRRRQQLKQQARAKAKVEAAIKKREKEEAAKEAAARAAMLEAQKSKSKMHYVDYLDRERKKQASRENRRLQKKRSRQSAIKIQCLVRSYFARKVASHLREEHEKREAEKVLANRISMNIAQKSRERAVARKRGREIATIKVRENRNGGGCGNM